MSNDENGYNGYTNYETWACQLWIDNDYDTCKHFEFLSMRTNNVSVISDAISAWINDQRSEIKSSGLLQDLLSGAISQINVREIAQNLINANYEPDDDESETDDAEQEEEE